MITDPIGDFLTRLRNAILREKESVNAPSSRMLESLAKILKEEGFIADFEVKKGEVQNELSVNLKYVNGMSAIRDLVRVSKPGIRKYRGYKEIKPVKKGLGLAIYSTPKGVMTGDQARKEKVGGEYICDVY